MTEYQDKHENERESAPRETESATIEPGEVVIGTLAGLDADGKPMVDFPGNPAPSPLPATSTQSIEHRHSGRQVALLFVDGELTKPLIVGLVHSPLHELLSNFETAPVSAGRSAEAGARREGDTEAYVDGERVVLEGRKEIVLKCGEASITLTRAGKIMIRGRYVVSRSDGVNRILGGSVQVN